MYSYISSYSGHNYIMEKLAGVSIISLQQIFIHIEIIKGLCGPSHRLDIPLDCSAAPVARQPYHLAAI